MFKVIQLYVLFSTIYVLTDAILKPNIAVAGDRIQGPEVNIENYPYQASIEYYGNFICGGSIIDRRRILTAAHCTDQRLLQHFKVRVGTSVQKEGGLLIDVSAICQHHEYDPDTFDNDISVLTLAHSIVFGSHAQAVDLEWAGAPDFPDGTAATVTGWGALWNIGPTSPNLRRAQVSLINQQDCRDAHGRCDPITDNMICFSNERNGGNDICRGDSGGPVVINNLQVGVISWGGGCSRPGRPGVYAKLSAIRNRPNRCLGVEI